MSSPLRPSSTNSTPERRKSLTTHDVATASSPSPTPSQDNQDARAVEDSSQQLFTAMSHTWPKQRGAQDGVPSSQGGVSSAPTPWWRRSAQGPSAPTSASASSVGGPVTSSADVATSAATQTTPFRIPGFDGVSGTNSSIICTQPRSSCVLGTRSVYVYMHASHIHHSRINYCCACQQSRERLNVHRQD